MKKFIAILLTLVLVLGLAACGSKPAEQTTTTTTETEKTKLNIVNLVNGSLGDKSFFDSAEAGLQQLQTDGYITYKTIQMGATEADRPKWKSTLEEVSATGEYDIVIVGTYNMQEYLTDVATNYPNQKYIAYDTEVALPNVASITYSQNQMSYLIGILAAWFTTNTSVANVNEDKVIGFIGGGDIPVINDFLVGYIEGAKFVDPEIKVDAQYVGGTSGWSDPATAKELSNVMINQYKCDVIFNVAGGSGVGMAEACSELGAWFIGVDSDQEKEFATAQPELAKVTLTSGLKLVGNSLIAVIKSIVDDGADPFGKTTALGLTNGGVGVADQGNYVTYFSDPAVTALIDKAKAGIEDKSITVDSAFDASIDVAAMRDEVSPRK